MSTRLFDLPRPQGSDRFPETLNRWHIFPPPSLVAADVRRL